MIKTFEQYNENKYVIINNIYVKIAISVKTDSTFGGAFMFKYLDEINKNDIRLYTLDEANLNIERMIKLFSNSEFEIISFEDLEVKMNANKYNL